jgi:predicted nucleic acid-binding protein
MSLFDSSSIVEALIGERSESIEVLKDGLRLELTFYEVGNSIRCVYLRQKKVEQADVARKMRAAARVLGIMGVAPIVIEDGDAIMQIAMDRSLTFYDASYLHAAKRDRLMLITEDDPLREAAEKIGCATKRFSELTQE